MFREKKVTKMVSRILNGIPVYYSKTAPFVKGRGRISPFGAGGSFSQITR